MITKSCHDFHAALITCYFKRKNTQKAFYISIKKKVEEDNECLTKRPLAPPV